MIEYEDSEKVTKEEFVETMVRKMAERNAKKKAMLRKAEIDLNCVAATTRYNIAKKRSMANGGKW